MSITGKLSAFICDTSYSDLQPKVIQDTKECIIDTLSGTLVGANYPDVKGIMQELNKYDRENEIFPAAIILDMNFRSRKEVCSAVNFIFKNLMTKTSAKMALWTLTSGTSRTTNGRCRSCNRLP